MTSIKIFLLLECPDEERLIKSKNIEVMKQTEKKFCQKLSDLEKDDFLRFIFIKRFE